MVRLTVDDISLRFPLYSKAQIQSYQNGDELDERIIMSPKGRILGIQALSNISFDLKSGDRLAVIGANGSGKTTLLQVISEIILPDSGHVYVEGRSTNLININLGIQPGASAHRNITLRGLAAGRTIKEIEDKRNEIIEFSELNEFINMPVETYSAGMKMRLNFAIATAFEPEILILDEWLSAGDISFKEKATARMGQFVEKAGILVLASHSKKMLMDNCERAIWIDNGKIRNVGDVETLWGEYAKEVHAQRAEAAALAKAQTADG